jgi:hypothetical protein
LNYVTPINPNDEEVAGIAATPTKIKAEMTTAWKRRSRFALARLPRA